MTFGLLIVSLFIILLSCEFFTNGIEWFGRRLHAGDGVIGSLLSAVGTCLPETMIPIIAILFVGEKGAVDIGIGAIAGAPFMLGTLAFFITGVSVFAFSLIRRTGSKMDVDLKLIERDLRYFILAYMMGIGCSFVEERPLKIAAGIFLVIVYAYYVYITVREDEAYYCRLHSLYISKCTGTRPSLAAICVQLMVALAGIVLGTSLFVDYLQEAAQMLHVRALVLSLILTPVATELPEKFNSSIWVKRERDTLALANISGAMVFQSCIPVAIGILFTPWKLGEITLFSAVIAITSATVYLLSMRRSGKVNPAMLLLGGVLYGVFIAFLSVQ